MFEKIKRYYKLGLYTRGQIVIFRNKNIIDDEQLTELLAE